MKLSVSNELESDRRLKEQERKYLLQLAKAKSEFESVVQAFEMCGTILNGKRRGNKACYSLVEKSFQRGKAFFDKVKSIRELASESVNATEDGK